MSQKIKAFAPASIGNVSCGFDVLGLAVQQPGDEVEITLNDSKKITIERIVGDGGRLPLETEKNTAGVAVIEFLKSIGQAQGASIVLHKNLPLGSGMGSSAASAVAAVVAINELMGLPLAKKELLPFAMEAERVACGSAHADNAAPSLLGGLILIRDNHPLDIIEIPTPRELFSVLVHPHIEVKTRDARSVLKQTISLNDGITQWANTAALVAGMMKEDYELIGRSLVDVVAEPLRADLIPGFRAIKSIALKNGALGCGISGSGPTVFCLCHGRGNAARAGKAMQQEFLTMKLESEVFVSEINRQGAYTIH
ncbi:MAG: homoserine kinase [Bacteroidetes bacterium]|nr:homoserine kinase [Bacteroidota bacterium]MBS1540518.1 homoserine kinase [Bacteroidota bacterium]